MYSIIKMSRHFAVVFLLEVVARSHPGNCISTGQHKSYISGCQTFYYVFEIIAYYD
jgi:hypothetical protein